MLTLPHQRVVSLLLIGATTALSVYGQPLPPADHFVSTETNFGHRSSYRGAVALSLASDWVGQWGDVDYSMQATAETSGGVRPQASVQAEAANGLGSYFQYNVIANAAIEYWVRIRARATPPPGSYSIPAIVNLRGEAQGYARSFARINYGPVYQVQTINSISNFDITIPMGFDPSSPESNLAFVQLSASATGYHLHATFSDSSQAYADPLFTLDQATFDLEQGANTFPLADYFEFEYSEYLLNPPAAPIITVHPQSHALCENDSVTLTADANSSAPLTYQWRLNGGDLLDGDGISGASTSNLTIDPAHSYFSGDIDCVISNVAGSVSTNTALITIDQPVAITIQPQSAAVDPGSSAYMYVTAAGTSLQYQWRKDGVDLVDGPDITGSTTFYLTVNSVDSTDVGSYDVVVSNGCNSLASDAALLTVTGSCAADFNSDTAVDFFDYLDFVDAFSAQLPTADFNQDSSIDFFDYLDFVDALSAGC